MALTPTPTPAPTPAPSMPTPTPPAQVPGSDIPSAQPPTPAEAVQTVNAPAVEQFRAANERFNQIAGSPTMPTPTGRHARLVAMIQGLSIGAGAFGESIATHGERGGAQEVSQIQAQQQEQKIRAQEEARAERNASLQQQLMVMSNAKAQMDMNTYLATLPIDLEAKHLALGEQQQKLAAGRVSLAKMGYDFQMESGVSADEWNALQSGTALPETTSKFSSFAQQRAGAYASVLGADDPSVTAVEQDVQALNATPVKGAAPADQQAAQKKLVNDMANLNREWSLKQGVTEATIKAGQAEQAEIGGSPKLTALKNYESSPTALAGENSAAAVSNLTSMLAGETDPQLRAREARLLGAAQASHTQWLFDQTSLASARALAQLQAQTGGTTSEIEAGQELLNGTTTLTDLRYATRNIPFTNAALQYAIHGNSDPKLGPVFKGNPNFSAATMQNYESVAKSATNNAFFGSANSLIQAGGTLDQLSAIGDKISQDDWKLLNKTKNWESLQSGGSPIAAYATTALGVADDYAKVMGGSVGSDTARTLVLNVINPSYSPPQRRESLDAMRSNVNSQKSARIGNNPYLKQMYSTTPTENAPKFTPPTAADVLRTGTKSGKKVYEMKGTLQWVYGDGSPVQ